MSVELLRKAATILRERSAAVRRPYGQQELVDLELADWLDKAGADLWAYGPIHCVEGCMECDDDLWAPHALSALAIARLIVGE